MTTAPVSAAARPARSNGRLGAALATLVLGCYRPDGADLVRAAPPAPAPTPLAIGPDVSTAVWVAPRPDPVVPSATALERRLEAVGARAGDIQVSLGWNSRDDLDLYLRTPCGHVLSFTLKSACGGHLDVDMNVGRTGLSAEAAENIFFAAGEAKPGTYHIMVTHAGDNSGLWQVPFVIRVVIAGVAQMHTGAVVRGGKIDVASFSWP